MAKHPLWNEEYWLLLLQLYQKKPMGVKPLYSKGYGRFEPGAAHST